MFLINQKVKSKTIETDLLERLNNGDESAINEVIRSHMRLVLDIAGQYASVTDTDGIDYVSEGVIGLLTACRDCKENLTGYIVTKIHSQIGNYIRRKKPPLVREGTYNPFKVIELEECIEKCVRTDYERCVIGMRREGYTDREIAIFTGTSTTTVCTARTNVYKRFMEENL